MVRTIRTNTAAAPLCLLVFLLAFNVVKSRAEEKPKERVATAAEQRTLLPSQALGFEARAPLAYPEKARQEGIEADILVEIDLDEKGIPREAKILRQQYHADYIIALARPNIKVDELFVPDAISYAMAGKYPPQMGSDQIPHPWWVVLPIRFRLEKGEKGGNIRPIVDVNSDQAAQPFMAESPIQRVRQAIDQIEENYVERPDHGALISACRKAADEKVTPLGNSDTLPASDDLSQLEAVLAKIRWHDVNATVDACVQGMVRTLDRLSSYLDQGDVADLQPGAGLAGGIGIELATSGDNGIRVVRPIEGGPAARAGVVRGDLIATVNDTDVRGRSLMEVIRMLRGALGSSATITIVRTGQPEPMRFTLKRELVVIESVYGRLLGAGIGYVAVTGFQEATPVRLARVMTDLRRENGGTISAVLLDLRWSPGGLLNSAVAVSAAFLPRGRHVAELKGRTKDSTISLRAEPQFYIRSGRNDPFASLPPETRSVPMVVLIGPQTASGAEIVASALQDHRRAILVGARSFGVGTVQSIIPLQSSTALKLTTSRVYKPSGETFDGKGIQPDVIVEIPQEADDGLPPYPSGQGPDGECR